MSAAMLKELGAAAGAAAVLDAGGFAGYGVEPAAVVAPDSADAAASVLALCSREGWTVLPCGNGTRPATALAALRRAAPGTRPILLSTARLADVHEYEPADLVAGVGAGMTHVQLRSVLAEKQQDLPLDPPTLAASTIGATIALNAAGPLRAGHGLPRDAVIGVQVATGDGRLLRFGGRVVKNVAGYDGVRFLTGSAGALGLITSVFLRLRGMPREDRTLLLETDSAANAAAAALAIRAAVMCDALELLSPRLAQNLGLHMKWSILARVRGGTAAVAEAVERIAAAAGPAAATSATVWESLRQREAEVPPAYAAVCPPAELPRLLDAIGDDTVAAHAADGTVRGWREGAVDEVRAAVLERGWVWRYPGVRSVRQQMDSRAADLERGLQATFDPAGILLPRLAVLP